MTRVLVIDDERDFRDQIRLSLEIAGCEVESAANCVEAVRMVPRYRPDVLVTDWMLRDHLHGLHISEVLGTVQPAMRTILMTGYGSRDLRAEAKGHRVAQFLEKPFEPKALLDAVRSAAAMPGSHHPPIGVLQVRPDGSIAWANEHARELFARSPAGSGADRIDGVVGVDGAGGLSPAPTSWFAISAPDQKDAWHFLGKDIGDGGALLVVLDDARLPVLRDHPVVQSLLGIEEATPIRWDLPGHVLLVDDEDYVRRFVAGQFQRAGCPCLTAENGEVALRLFARDEHLRYVLLDWSLPGDDTAALVREFKRIRPDAIIVGVSGEDRTREFAGVGIERVLAKPVRIESLLAELREAESASPRAPVESHDEAEWDRRLGEICAEFDQFMKRRPGARATRAMAVVEVLRNAWPRAMTVQDVVEAVWPDSTDRARRAAGSVRNALHTLTRNFEEFNHAVTEPLHGIRCELWRSEEGDSRLCRYALRLHPVAMAVETDGALRDYLSQVPRPVLESMHAFIRGDAVSVSPGARQVCRDLGMDLADPALRDVIVRIVER